MLDEPTLGLDILYRKQFYDSLLNDYFDRSRTIVVTTHQVEEVQHVLTDLMFIDRGRIVLECSMEEFESRYLEVMVRPEQLAAARALRPIHERQVFGRSILLFDGVDRQQLAALGEVRTPSIADLFVAVIGNEAGRGARSGHMSTPSNAVPESPSTRRPPAPAALPATRPLYWSVRRELWENRSLYMAPLAVAAVVLFGFLIRTIGLPARMRAVRCPRPGAAAGRAGHALQHGGERDHAHDVPRRRCSTASTRCTASGAIAASCSGSRCRSRTSRPCSRRRRIPARGPAACQAFAIVLATQLAAAAAEHRSCSLASGSSAAHAVDTAAALPDVAGACSTAWPCTRSGTRRSTAGCCWSRPGRGARPFLWAVLPPLAIGVVERMAFGTSHFGSLLAVPRRRAP